jgi:hypothetical protein
MLHNMTTRDIFFYIVQRIDSGHDWPILSNIVTHTLKSIAGAVGEQSKRQSITRRALT